MKKVRCAFVLLLFLSAALLLTGAFGLAGNERLMEYAAPYSPDSDTSSPSLLTALSALRRQMQGAQLTASIYSQDGQVQSAAGQTALCDIKGISTEWFDLYHQTFLAGRCFGEREVVEGKPVAIVSEALAYSLWGDEEVLGAGLLLNGKALTVVGIVENKRLLVEDEPELLYVPLQTAFDLRLPADVQMLSGCGGRMAAFEMIAGQHVPGGSCYSHQQEMMRAGMLFRYLAVTLLLLLLGWGLRRSNALTRAGAMRWTARSKHVYGRRMLLPSALFGIQLAITYGLWLVLLYLTLNIAIEPAYVFSEWIPEDLSRLSGYIEVFKTALQQQTRLNATLTERVIQIRRSNSLIHAGCILALVALAIFRPGKPVGEEQ